MENAEYTIGDLAKLAGVSIRTIRYYVSEGLLPKPQVRGRYTYYDASYLERIKIVRRLKEAFLPLKEIRKIVESNNLEEIKHRLSEKEMSNELDEKADEEKDRFFPVQLFQDDESSQPRLDQHYSLAMLGESVNIYQPAILWRREEIIQGVELHFQQPEDGELAKKLAQYARKIYQVDQS